MAELPGARERSSVSVWVGVAIGLCFIAGCEVLVRALDRQTYRLHAGILFIDYELEKLAREGDWI
jgi:hypothetical protein